MPKQRLRITVPKPEATINLGNPDPGARFGWEGISLKSGRHMFVGVEDDVVFQADGSTLFQTDEKWFQYAGEMTHATEERLHLTSGDAMILFAGGGQAMHAEDEFVEGDLNTYDENTKSPITNTFNKIDLMRQVQAQAAHVRKFLGGDAKTKKLGEGFIKKSARLEVDLGHRTKLPEKDDIEQCLVIPDGPDPPFPGKIVKDAEEWVNETAGISENHDALTRFNPYMGPLGVANFMLDVVRKLRIIAGTDNVVAKLHKELADTSKAAWKARDQHSSFVEDFDQGPTYGERIGRAMFDKYNEPADDAQPTQIPAALNPQVDGNLTEDQDKAKALYKKFDNFQKGWDSATRAAFEPLDRAFAVLSSGTEATLRAGRTFRAATRFFTGDYEDPAPLGILAKGGITLGTENRIYGAASKGFYFVADGATYDLDKDKEMRGKPVQWLLQKLDKLGKGVNRTKEAPKPPSLGFVVRSDSDVDMKADYLVSLTAVDTRSLVRIASAGVTDITASNGVAVGPRGVGSAMEVFGHDVLIGVRSDDRHGIRIKRHTYQRPNPVDEPTPAAPAPAEAPNQKDAPVAPVWAGSRQNPTQTIVLSAEQTVTIEAGKYLVEVGAEGVRVGLRREAKPAVEGSETEAGKRAELAFDVEEKKKKKATLLTVDHEGVTVHGNEYVKVDSVNVDITAVKPEDSTPQPQKPPEERWVIFVDRKASRPPDKVRGHDDMNAPPNFIAHVVGRDAFEDEGPNQDIKGFELNDDNPDGPIDREHPMKGWHDVPPGSTIILPKHWGPKQRENLIANGWKVKQQTVKPKAANPTAPEKGVITLDGAAINLKTNKKDITLTAEENILIEAKKEVNIKASSDKAVKVNGKTIKLG